MYARSVCVSCESGVNQCVVWESFVCELCDCCVNVVQGILECELCVDHFCLSGFLSAPKRGTSTKPMP